jgi:hypothetical protein
MKSIVNKIKFKKGLPIKIVNGVKKVDYIELTNRIMKIWKEKEIKRDLTKIF